MILPRWYRLARSLWTLPLALLFWYCSFILLTIEHASPEVQANGNEQEVLIIARILGVMFLIAGVGTLVLTRYLYNRLPYRMRRYSFEELRLGQAIYKEVERLREKTKHWFGDHDFGDHVLSWSMSERSNRLWNNVLFLFSSYMLSDVHVTRRQLGITDTEGVDHCPTVTLIIEMPTGVVRFRNERIELYKDGRWLHEGHKPFDVEHWKFRQQMQMDRPSIEELQLFLDDLRSM